MKEFHQELNAAINALSEKQRQVFLLNRIEKKKYKEIANTNTSWEQPKLSSIVECISQNSLSVDLNLLLFNNTGGSQTHNAMYMFKYPCKLGCLSYVSNQSLCHSVGLE